jgi:hypothetical protein
MHYCFQQPTSQTYNLKGTTKHEGVLRHKRSKFSVRSFRKSNLFRQIMPELSSISLLLYSFSGDALMAKTTRNVIQGSAPYLTFDGGVTRATNADELLAITLSDGTRITPSTNPSNPIQLPNGSDSFADIVMSVPVGADSIALNALIGPPNNYWADDDGDGQGRGDITVTGNLELHIANKMSRGVDRRDKLDICYAPYKVILESSGGTLSTRYGFPNSSNFSASSVTYHITPKASPKACFARPSQTFGSDDEQYWPGYHFAGPSNIWNPVKGFLVQSTEPSGYHKNFPTTGANNLYFDLDIGGINANELSWSPVTHSGITATMTPHIRGINVRVKLTGPVATSAQMSSDSPGIIPRPALPATFELVGRDSNGRAVIKYGFTLKQWFVNRGGDRKTGLNDYSNSSSWCNSVGYQMPRVRDLTNAQCTGSGSAFYCQGAEGATPSSPGNHYQRRIDSGFFTEWGRMGYWDAANFAGGGLYWTSDAGSDGNQFTVTAYSGGVMWDDPSKKTNFVLCSSALKP